MSGEHDASSGNGETAAPVSPSANQNLTDTTTTDVSQVVGQTHLHAGPLPPPSTLQAYDQIHPGTAERIIRRWEQQTDHRHRLERRGQWFALTIALAGMGSGIVCTALGEPWVGGGIAITAVLGISVTALIRLLPRT